MTTHNKKKPVEEPETPAPDLQIVTSEPEPASVTPQGAEGALERLRRQVQAEPQPGGTAA